MGSRTFSSGHARKVTVKILQIRIVNEEGLPLAGSPLARSFARATETARSLPPQSPITILWFCATRNRGTLVGQRPYRVESLENKSCRFLSLWYPHSRLYAHVLWLVMSRTPSWWGIRDEQRRLSCLLFLLKVPICVFLTLSAGMCKSLS